MKKYQYQIIRYLHDRLTGEFVNVGIVMFSKENNFLGAEVIEKSNRLSKVFSTHNNWPYYISILKNIKNQCEIISKQFDGKESINSYSSIVEISKDIIPTNDSSLYFSEPKTAMDLDLSFALKDRFERLVSKYNNEVTRQVSPTDSYVWKTIYQKYFEEYGISKELKKHKINTKHDVLEFNKTWKNGVWHLYEPVSFDLKSIDAIKEKVYNWIGKISELELATENSEPLNLYILTSTIHTKDDKTNIEAFIHDTLTSKNDEHFTVKLIKESEAAEFAIETKKEIELAKNNHE